MGPAYKYGVFAAMLQNAMADHGVTQAHLAAQLGVEQQAVSKWATGQTRPKAETLIRLAAIFGWDQAAALGAVTTPPDQRTVPPERPTTTGRLRALELKVEAQAETLEEIRQLVLELLQGGLGAR